MPSFKSVLFVLAALSTSVLARPNHADEYGYPHGLGPQPGPHKKMTPGGYIDTRPNNQGSKCRKNRECTNPVPLAVGYCNKIDGANQGTCSFTCVGTSVKQGNRCVGAYNAPACKIDANCPPANVKDGRAACIDSVCRIACDTGFHLNGSATRCDKNKTTCGGKAPPTVDNGFAICKKGHWQPKCNAYPGGMIYSTGPDSYKCVNTNVDPKNCGTMGNVCPAGYNGLGMPVCMAGFCDLNCNGMRVRRHNGKKYCSAM